MKSKNERLLWLQEWLRANHQADVLNSDLVFDYVEATQAKSVIKMIGAPKCKQLGIDLSTLFKTGIATRNTTGISDGFCHQGFPRWVWSYRLKQKTGPTIPAGPESKRQGLALAHDQ